MALKDLFDQVKALDNSAPKDVSFGQVRDKVATDNGIDPAAFKKAYDVYHTSGQVPDPSFMGSYLQGATANFSDELGGFGAKLGTKEALRENPELAQEFKDRGIDLPQQNDNETTAKIRAENALYRDQHPALSIAGNIAGGIPLAVATRKIPGLGGTSEGGLRERAIGSILPGAAYGSAYGAGSGEGGIENRLVPAGVGAMFGMAAAPLVTTGLALGSRAASAVGNKLSEYGQEASDWLGNKLNIPALQNPPVIPAGANLHPLDAQKAVAMTPDKPVDVLPAKAARSGVANAADLKIAEAAKKAGVDPVELADRIAKGEVPPNSIPFDMLGNETKDLARSSSVIDNATGQKLITQMQQRNQLHNQQIGQAIQKSSGLDATDPYEFVSAVEAKAKGDAAPYYDAARSAKPVPPAAQVNLSRPGETPVPISVGDLLKQKDIAAAASKAKSNDPRLKDLPANHPAVLDQVYKSLGDDLTEAMSKGRKNDAALVMERRDAVKQAIDSVSDGAYSKATSLYSEGMGPKNAFEEGQQAMKNGVSEADIKNQMGKYSGDALDAYKKGQLVSLSDMIAQKNARSDVTQSFLNSPLMKSKLQSLASSPEEYANLQKTLGELHDQHAGSQYLQGSMTAEKLNSAAQNYKGDNPQELFDKLVEFGDAPIKTTANAAKGAISRAYESASTGSNKAVAGAVLARLGQAEPEAQQAWLRSLPATQNRLMMLKEAEYGANRLSRMTGGNASNQVGDKKRNQIGNALMSYLNK